MQYTKDVVAFVKAAVNKSLKHISDDDNAPPSHKAFRKERKRALKDWEKSKYPLSLGNSSHQAFVNLTLAISEDETTAAKSLPIAAIEQMPVSTFFATFYDMAKPSSSSRRISPAIPNGPSFSILQAALRHSFQIMDSSSSFSELSIRNRLLSFFIILISEHKINFFPHLPVQPDTPGSRFTLPNIKAWSRLGGSSKQDKAIEAVEAATPSVHTILHKAAKLIARSDPRSEWSINDYKISQAHLILKKDIPPSDWSIKNAGLSPSDKINYVGETYNWASRRFNSQYSSLECQLAIILSFLVSKQLPDVCWLKPSTSSSKTERDDFTDYVQQLSWLPPPTKKKGYTSTTIYFTQLSTFILAIISSSSPLRRYAANNSYSLGPQWNKKHSSFFSSFSSLLIFISLISLGQKSIGPVALVRLRLAWAGSMAVFGSHKLNDSYGIYPSDQLQLLLQTIKQYLLSSNSSGPLNLCRLIFGPDTTLILAEKGQIHASNHPSGSRHNVIVIPDTDDENQNEDDSSDIDFDNSSTQRPSKRRRMA